MNANNETSGISPRVLPSLQIPVIDITGNGGLGKTDLADPQKGVPLFADILFGTQAGDYVELFWNGRDVQHFEVNDGHLSSGVISFSVPPQDIPDSPPDTQVYYRLTTRQGGNQDSSPTRPVVVKRTVPGDPDPDNTTPVTNENLPPPRGVPPVLSVPQDVDITVDPWLEMHVGDVLTLYWGGTRHSVRNPPLTDLQLGQPQTVRVPAQTVVDAGDSEKLIVNYEIRDVVNNWSLYSLPAFTDVQIDPNAPGAPVVVEADPTTKEIDLAALGAADVNVRIPPVGLNPGDMITLHWLGQTDQGVPVVPVIAPLPVDPNGFTPVFKVANADVAAIASGTARVYYVVQPGARRSRSETISVVGQPVPLAAPTLDGAVGNSIDPAVVPATGAIVRVMPYAAKAYGDLVILLWEGLDSAGNALVFTADYSVGRNEENDVISFTVPKQKLVPLANGMLTLSYTVKFMGGSSRPSTSVTYQVLGSALLPKPTVDNAPGDVFDPDQYIGTVVHIGGAAALLKRLDEVTVYWAGSSAAASDSRSFLVSTDNQDLSWSIAGTLIDLSRNDQVRVRYEVKRAVGTDNSDVRVVQISVGVKPAILSIVDSKGVLIPKNTDTSDTNVILTGTAAPNSTVELLDHAIVWATVSAPAGSWTKDSPGLAVGPHSMTARTGASTSDPWPFRVVTAPVFDLRRPRVPKAYGDGTYLNFDSAMYYDDYLAVIVNYTGMAPGQTIQLHWMGAVAYHSEIKTVGAVGDIEFRVPRMEVVDVIGRAAAITYTVKLADGTTVGTSAELPLRVDPQPFDLVPPTISAGNRVVTVAYPGMNTPHTGRVRWSGVVTHDTAEQYLDTRPENFDIPASWVNENRGRDVLINYTVYRSDGNHFLFSRVLRKRM